MNDFELQKKLLWACRKGDKKSVAACLSDPDNRANVNAIAPEDMGDCFAGKTALHVACTSKHLPIVVSLLQDYRADPNIALPCDGATPLHVVVSSGKLMDEDGTKARIVQFLLQFGADPNLETKRGHNAMHIASHLGNTRHIQRLAAYHGNVEKADPQGFTPLAMACKRGHLALVHWLLSSGRADPNRAAGGLDTAPLAVVCKTRNVNVMAVLLHHGARMDQGRLDDTLKEILAQEVNDQGRTVLHCLAAMSSNLDAVEWLLASCGNKIGINATDYKFNSVLHLACQANSVELVRRLLQEPYLAVDGLNVNGDSPLNSTNSADVAFTLLLDHRMRDILSSQEVHRPNHKGETPLLKASRLGKTDLVRVLLGNGADPNVGSPLYYACKRKRIDLVAQLLAYGAIPNGTDGHFPLHAACRVGDYSMVMRLFEADVNAIDPKNGQTAVHVACHGGHVEIVEHLVRERGARLDIRDHKGRTPLQVAEQRRRAANLAGSSSTSLSSSSSSSSDGKPALPKQTVSCRGGQRFMASISYWEEHLQLQNCNLIV